MKARGNIKALGLARLLSILGAAGVVSLVGFMFLYLADGRAAQHGTTGPGSSRAITAKTASRAGRYEKGTRTAHGLRSLPRSALTFEPNVSQTNPKAKFLARGGGYTLFLTGDGMVLLLSSQEPRVSILNGRRKWQVASDKWQGAKGLLHSPFMDQASKARSQKREVSIAPDTRHLTPETVRLRLLGANPKATVVGLDRLKGISNYFIGNDPKKWRTNVPNYARVMVKDLYPGIDQVFYGKDGQLEYDFVVHPGADPRAIRVDVEVGLVPARGRPQGSPLRIASNGDIVIPTEAGEVRFARPIAYQLTTDEGPRTEDALNSPFAIHNSELSPVPSTQHLEPLNGGYALSADNQITFALPNYDKSRTLVIDPTLNYLATFGGSNGNSQGQGIAVDSSGNAYVAGFTHSTDFAATPGAFQTAAPGGGADAVVLKVNSSGALVFATYLGGSGIDAGFAIAVDSSGDAYVTGTTASSDFPVVNAYQPTLAGGANAFVSEISSTGSALVYSSYLGGAMNATLNAQQGYGIAVDSAANAYVTGVTQSSDFPTTPGVFQPNFGGGTCGSPSLTFPCSDAFVTKVAPGGSTLVYSTFLGGSNLEDGLGIALDSAGNAYVAGLTESFDFPTHNAFQATCGAVMVNGVPTCSTAFITELDPSGSGVVFSTYFGGTVGDEAFGLALDPAANIYVTGITASPDFPLANAFQPTLKGSVEAFLTQFNPGASQLIYSTYLGGSDADFARGVAVDSFGEAFVTGWTSSTDFPAANAIQGTLGCGASGTGSCVDAFVTVFETGGAGLAYSTYLGNGEQMSFSIATDAGGDAWITGESGTPTFASALSRPEVVHRQVLPRLASTTSTTTQGLAGSIALDMARVSVAPPSLAFEPELAGATTASQAVTISNPGTAALLFSDITASNNFSVTSGGTCSTSGSVAPNSNCTVNVAFAPTMGGNLTGTLTLTDNGIGSPQTVALGGTGQDFVVSAIQNLATVSPGGTAIYALSVAPQGGLNQSVAFGCIGGPPFSECTVSPNSIVTSGTGPAAVTVSVKTYGSSLVAPRGPFSPPPAGRRTWPMAVGFVVLALAVLARLRPRIPVLEFRLAPASLAPACKARETTPYFHLALFLLLLMLVTWSSCGGGSNNVQNRGTPVGRYSLTVTARTASGSTSLAHTLALTLKVI